MANGLNQSQDAGPPDQQESDAEGRGGDHREIQDNGTQGKTSNVFGAPSGNSFPGDSYAEVEGTKGEITDYGLNESVEVGHQGGVQDYGISGPPAGGGVRKNTIQ